MNNFVSPLRPAMQNLRRHPPLSFYLFFVPPLPNYDCAKKLHSFSLHTGWMDVRWPPFLFLTPSRPDNRATRLFWRTPRLAIFSFSSFFPFRLMISGRVNDSVLSMSVRMTSKVCWPSPFEVTSDTIQSRSTRNTPGTRRWTSGSSPPFFYPPFIGSRGKNFLPFTTCEQDFATRRFLSFPFFGHFFSYR